MSPVPPLVLTIAGHDPTGGAGVQADLESIAALGGQGLSVVTALTAQNTFNVAGVLATPVSVLEQQLDVLLADCRPAAVKIGLIGDAGQIPLLARILAALRVPVVLDPVLRAGGGTDLATRELMQRLLDELLPQVTVVTPNAAEARRLTGGQEPAEAATALLGRGTAHVLITGGDEPTAAVRNRWYAADGTARHWDWPRLPETFHGAGCTLASALATLLAQGQPVPEALERAQAWTHRALAQAIAVGQGRRIPCRRRFPDMADPSP